MLARHERHLIARYLWPGAGGRLVLLVGAIGCVGVAIGVASLVLVLAVMNGATAKLASSVAPVDGHLSITAAAHRLMDEAQVAAAIARLPGVARAKPLREITAALSIDGRMGPIRLQGLYPDGLARHPGLSRMAMGRRPDSPDSIAVGENAALQLGLLPGMPVALGRVEVGSDGAVSLKLFDARVAGLYHDDEADGGQSPVVIGPVAGLPILDDRAAVTRRVAVTLTKPADEAMVTGEIRRRLGPGYRIASWTQSNRALLAALATEKIGMTIAVGLVTVIALFNILSSMTLLARSKRREIAVLRSMGMSARGIARVFTTVGSVIAGVGAVAGLTLASGLLTQRDRIAAFVLWLAPTRERDLDVFLSLPIGISPHEVTIIGVCVLAGAVLASLYPAWQAARVSPALVLRGE
ncbi:ABC transporter permease [Sphingomonas sp. SORGH_AS_0879]|uniref:ABC transporter permease n=1 Tax=Sphingomonas sp. SORGH_AS_0879 TaxID=3041790 RepID=UPI00277DBDF1|nr:ABC transporter permease [Sphingomonas sp. SORGH_AS_0879]MDQ1229068.1 lipoprotein-releasing system permease protein [Sphingomonas sp. SORGH_AS_0879]